MDASMEDPFSYSGGDFLFEEFTAKSSASSTVVSGNPWEPWRFLSPAVVVYKTEPDSI